MSVVSRRQFVGFSTLGTAGAVMTMPSARAAGPSRCPSIAVVGSGYGGAVAARALTRRGYTVSLIEKGDDWRSMPRARSTERVFDQMSNPTGRSTWLSTTTDLPFATFLGLDLINKPVDRGTGVLDAHRYAGVTVYRGIGLGGGSLVNGTMAVTPKREFFERVLPQIDADEMYSTYFPTAVSLLGASLLPPTIMASPWYKFSRVGAEQAKRAGLRIVDVPTTYDKSYLAGEVAGTVTRSALDQELLFGNNAGRYDLTKTLLADAFATGRVVLHALTEVSRITRSSDGRYALTLTQIDTRGSVVATRTEVFDRVVLAAGSIGTSELLVRAKATGDLPQLPAETGRRWGPNGNVMCARWHGRPVGGRASTIAAHGIDAWDGSDGSVLAEIAPLPTGVDTFSSLYLSITNNPNYGTFDWDGTKVTLDWNSMKAAPSVAAAKAVMDRMKRVNSGVYRSDLFKDGKTFTDYFTYHPLGGMILGEATDLNGEVKGMPGLFVMDGSLIPAKIGANPFVTITALAQRNMDKLLAAGRF